MMFLIEITPGATPEIIQIARQSADEVRRIEALARSTLGFFRQANAAEKVDLKASAESVRLLLEPLIRQREIAFEIHAAGDCVVNAIPAATRHVLLNLVRNACEATNRKGAKVTVTMTGGPEAVEVLIADQGTGIDSEIIPSLFQFGATTKGERGNGMGLWVVKKLLDKHAATINLESKSGQGTRVMVIWPREIPNADEGAELASASVRP
jgi:signal transduction histidine kinase